ncbi:ribonuclease P protein component [Aquiflexum lacus]|uniref:ribonuclease P protein component n=1 Tax=Aquiflexum lacus TaxID=2483805 RepID=UPI001893A521|nr:ribonuclease P protein component [Aquiflexum lacus]
MNKRLTKNERLHSQKLIKELFDKGSSFFLYPFKVMLLESNFEDSETNQVLFSVSKKKVNKAVHRNLIKRRIKEAYRLNKQILSPLSDKKKIIGLIYVSSEIATFQFIQNKLRRILATINES